MGLAGVAGTAWAEPDPNFHLYLLVGQSNMAGRGAVDEEGKTEHPRVKVLTKELEWKPATDPLHFDKPGAAGVGPGLVFGKKMAEAFPEATIGLVPCAAGGSPIQAWAPGAFHGQTNSHPYDDTLVRMREAAKAGVLKGILWHQGESNRTTPAETYGPWLVELVARLRKDLAAPDVPFIAGEIVSFREDSHEPTRLFNAALHATLAGVPGTAVVSGEGMRHRGDQLHFDTASARLLGLRYAEALLAFGVANATPDRIDSRE